MTTAKKKWCAVSAFLVFAFSVSSAWAQEERQVFSAFAVAQANGAIMRVAEDEFLVAATLAGPLFVDTNEGPVESGQVKCLASLKVQRSSVRTMGSGACSFTAEDSASAWGEWHCEGYLLMGCRGTFKLAGGSGRFEGVSGESQIIWRPSASELQKQLDGTTLASTHGLVLWREFKLARTGKQ